MPDTRESRTSASSADSIFDDEMTAIHTNGDSISRQRHDAATRDNRLGSGTIHSSESVYTEYPDPRHDEWSAVRHVLWKIPLATFEEMTGKSRRRLIDARSGRREPHPDTRALLAFVARRLDLIR